MQTNTAPGTPMHVALALSALRRNGYTVRVASHGFEVTGSGNWTRVAWGATEDEAILAGANFLRRVGLA